MPRMTIFRSKFTASLLVLGALAGPLSAAGAQAAARPTPTSYTVKAGDTMFSIAGRLLGDSFLWPQIYRLNTQVVEDPHWIYPGEVLVLVGGADSRAVPAQDTPAPQAADPIITKPTVQPERPAVVVEPEPDQEPVRGDTLFARRRGLDARAALRGYREQPYQALRRGEFFSAGYLSEGQALPFGTLRGEVTPPQIRNLSERAAAGLYAVVAVLPPAGAKYRVNDSLLVVQTFDGPTGYGDIIYPTGMLRVTGESGGQFVGTMVAVYGPVRSGQHVLPAEKFTSGGTSRAQPVANGLVGVVLGQREVRELKHPQDYLYINLGSKDGVARGDVFEIRRDPAAREGGPASIDELMAVIQVVHVREHSATAKVVTVVSPDIPPGSRVKQVGKLPS